MPRTACQITTFAPNHSVLQGASGCSDVRWSVRRCASSHYLRGWPPVTPRGIPCGPIAASAAALLTPPFLRGAGAGVDEHVWHLRTDADGGRELAGCHRPDEGEHPAACWIWSRKRSGTVYKLAGRARRRLSLPRVDAGFKGYKNAIDDQLQDATSVLVTSSKSSSPVTLSIVRRRTPRPVTAGAG